MSRMNKADLMEWLRENQIDFPPSATVRLLRSLYKSHIGAQGGTPNDNEDDGDGDGDGSSSGHEDPLDLELRMLQKRKMIANLRRELEDIEQTQGKPPTIQDVMNSVARFSGGDTCDANRWLSDFESACGSLGGNDDFKFKCIRRLMEPGTEAEWFLRVDKSKNYTEFRTSFLDNFGHTYTVAEIVDKLRKTTYDALQMSVAAYILRMQEIASRANIDENQTVQFIIDGFQDRSANIAVLYPAKDLAHLKQLSRRYVQLREMYPTTTLSLPARQKMKPAASKPDLLRCYNCSGIGHLSAACKEPRRAKGSCFRCGSTQHQLKECPKPSPRNNSQVALADEFRQNANGDRSSADAGELGAALSELNIVSIAFSIDSNTHLCSTVLSMFDTGSPISFVRRSVVPQSMGPREKVESGYKSIGNYPLCTYGIIRASISFRDRKICLKVHVVPDNYLCVPLLLGRNFLKEVGITLYDTRFIDLIDMKSNIELEIGSDPNRIKISGKVLHCVFDYSNDAHSELIITCNQCDSSPASVISNMPNLVPQVVVPLVPTMSKQLDSIDSVQLSSVHSDISNVNVLNNSVLSNPVPLEGRIPVPMSHCYPVPDVFCIDLNDSDCDYAINPELSVVNRNYDLLNDALSSIDWEFLDSELDLDEMVGVFNTEIRHVIEAIEATLVKLQPSPIEVP
ncbi:uncharacterized protein LOC135700098 [Ochlerotatus camptorhynchus]|uniref:uncharacterized protein LOC135700098 n=1 Tax=Ochlerotatus camptorhynchus TaxID=644619 RepID=UPI0031E4199B